MLRLSLSWQNSTLLSLVEDDSKLFGSKSHFEVGDGAPVNALFTLGRVALGLLRKQRKGEATDDSTNEDMLLDAQEGDAEEANAGAQPEEGDSDTDSSADSTDDASTGSGSSGGTNKSDQAGAANGAPNAARIPSKKLTKEQARVLNTCIILILGIWHCMQESIIVNLEGNRDAWAFFARDWRLTEGRLKFLLSCGNVNEALDELFSAVCGMLKWWMQRYRKTNPAEPSYVGFDQFMDEEAARSPVLAKLKELIEHTLITKCLFDSMRQGMLGNVRLLLEQLAELCAATCKHKYMRLIVDFRVQVATMPLADLAFLFEAMFTDMGSYFAPSDEVTEIIHSIYERLVGRSRRDRSWVKGVVRVSMTLPHEEPGRRLGSASGVGRAPSGHRECNMWISSATRQRLEGTFGEDEVEGQEVNIDGARSSARAAVGFGGEIPPLAMDSQQTGRALLRADVQRLVFGGSSASAAKRPTPPRPHLTAEHALKARLRRRAQVEAKTPVAIESTSYLKSEMVSDLKKYEAQSAPPRAVAAALAGSRGEKDLYIPSVSKSRRTIAEALSRWRNVARELCERAHSEEGPSTSELSLLVQQEQSTISRRTEARRRLGDMGKLVDLAMTVTDAAEVGTTGAAGSDEASGLGALGSWLESHRRIARAGPGAGAAAAASSVLYAETESQGNSSSFVSSPLERASDDPSRLRRFARTLKANGRQGAVMGRQAQMEAARTFRRTAEIKALVDERSAAVAMDTAGSPWNDPALEPPAASMGNAVSWRPPDKPELPRAPLQAPGPARPPAAQGGGRGGTELPVEVARRHATCSCCAQPRVLGHVHVCTHTNKVCFRCRSQAANAGP